MTINLNDQYFLPFESGNQTVHEKLLVHAREQTRMQQHMVALLQCIMGELERLHQNKMTVKTLQEGTDV